MNSPELEHFPNAPFFTRKVYTQRSGTQDSGRLYESVMTALMALRATLDENILDMWVASNGNSLGVFDDLVLYTDHKFVGKKIYVVQLKHKDNVKIVKSSLTNQKGSFYLDKYKTDYKTIKETLLKGDEYLLGFFDGLSIDDVTFLLYTNTDFKNDTSEFLIKRGVTLKRVQHRDIFNTGVDGGCVYKINCDGENDDFYSKFYFYTRQSRAENIENLIYSELKDTFGEVGVGVSQNIVSFFNSWAAGELNGHYKLTKDEMKTKLFELFISPYMVEPCMTKSCETEVWRKLLDVVDVVVVEEITPMITGYVYLALQQTVDKYYGDELQVPMDKWNAPLAMDVIERIEKNVAIKTALNGTIGLKTNLTCKLFYTTLWKMGVIPLVVDVSDYILNNSLKKLRLSKAYKLRLIILGNRFEKTHNLRLYKMFTSLSDIPIHVAVNIVGNLRIRLQGRIAISLKELIHLDENILKSICSTTLLMILMDETMVGRKYEESSEFYIDRNILKPMVHIDVLEKTHGQVFIITGQTFQLERTNTLNVIDFEDVKICKPSQGNVVSFVSTLPRYNFESLLGKYIAVHHLYYNEHVYRGHLQWLRTWGNVNTLSEFVIPSKFLFNFRRLHQADAIKCVPRKVNIICAEPGMGKSALMTNMANSSDCVDWILLVNLNKITVDLNQNMENLIDYFYDKIEPDTNPLSKAVFDVFKSRKKIIILLDGFDEISPTYTANVTKVVQWFEINGFTTWVSSRPVMKRHLESSFNTLCFTLESFTIDDVYKYLRKCENDDQNGALLIKNVKKISTNVLECMKNPLQLKIAVNYIKSNNFNEQQIDIVVLYDKFIDQMLEMYWRKSDWDTRNNIAVDETEERNREFKKMHVKLSLTLFFDMDVLYEVTKMKKVPQFLESIRMGKKGIGIVIDVTENMEPVFGHRTFAEYLTGKWLAKNIKKDKIKKLLPKLFTPEFVFIKEVFDRILASRSTLHTAVINLNVDYVSKCSNMNIDGKDLGERTPLHLAASRGKRHYYPTTNFTVKSAEHYTDEGKNEEIFKILLEKGANPYDLDTFMEWNVFNYAARMSCLNLIEILYDRGYQTYVGELMPIDSLAYFCSINNYINIVERMDEFPKIQTLENGQNPIHITSTNGYVALLQLILKKSKYLGDVDAKDRGGNTALYYAAQNGHNNCIKVLLENGADVNAKNGLGQSPITVAALHGKASTLCYLKSKGVDVNALDIDQGSPLHYAVKGGNVYCVHLLIRNGCKVNAEDCNGWTPLLLTAVRGHEDIVEYLLRNGADVNRNNHAGETALYLAAMFGHVQCVSLLLDFRADVALKCNNMTALDVAASKRHLECVKVLVKYATTIELNNAFHLALKNCHVNCVNYLLDIGIDINAQSNYGTPLFHTVCSQIENASIITNILIQRGADVNTRFENGDTPLHKAAETGNFKIFKILVENGADVNAANINGMTPLHKSVKPLSEKCLLFLLEQDVDINAQDVDGFTPIHLAMASPWMSNASVLINRGADLNIADSSGRIPLHVAAEIGDLNCANSLICKNSNVNAICKNGFSPLHMALIKNHVEISTLLIKSNADVNTPTRSGTSPLHWACYHGNEDLVRALLRNNASVNVQSNAGLTPLDHAVISGNLDLCEYLTTNLTIRGSAQIKATEGLNLREQFIKNNRRIRKRHSLGLRNIDSWTDLHFASEVGDTIYVPYLIDIINEADKFGTTALHVAAENGHLDFIDALISNGAKCNATTKFGLTPLDLAIRNNHEDVVSFLFQKGADQNVRDEDDNKTINYKL